METLESPVLEKPNTAEAVKTCKRIYPIIYKNSPQSDWLDPTSEAPLEGEAGHYEEERCDLGQPPKALVTLSDKTCRQM